jgi:hypothetical protein
MMKINRRSSLGHLGVLDIIVGSNSQVGVTTGFDVVCSQGNGRVRKEDQQAFSISVDNFFVLIFVLLGNCDRHIRYNT